MIQEKTDKSNRHAMLFWESKIIHKLKNKSKHYTYFWPSTARVPLLYYVGTDKNKAGK